MILVAGCEPGTSTCIGPILRSLQFVMELVSDSDSIRAYLQASEMEVAAVILGTRDLGMDCLEILREIRSVNSYLPVVIAACRPTTDEIVAAIKCGASDFLSIPIQHDNVVSVLTRAIDSGCRAGRRNRPQYTGGTAFFVGRNARMKELHALAERVGPSEVPVLIQGETGTGKEVLALELISRSKRATRPFLKLNCAALPSELIESELFGYERGAFTGAFQRKAGMFELADGGTLMLDEIGDMDFRLQAKLLQVLQDREFRRIGGKETVKVDVRIIAATHCDLEKAIVDRTFREDLYYRLNLVNLVLPPLRERREDIVPLAEYLISRHADKAGAIPMMTAELEDAMLAYHWPGNVRELENKIRKVIIFQDCNLIAREIRIRTQRKSPWPAAPPSEGALAVSPLDQVTRAKEQAEITAILDGLNSTRWNRKQAAAILNIDYKALLYRMKKLGIDGGPIPVPDHSAALPARSAKGA
jgi:two-component system response regulator AtoC